VSKISAAVVATIALINTLIKAYNLLKASAIVAGVATAFALNPLLGVGAVALAAGVLAGANALARSGDTEGADAFATTGTPGAISGGGNVTRSLKNAGFTQADADKIAAADAAKNTADAVKRAADIAKKAGDSFVAGAFDTGATATTSLEGINAASNQAFAFGTSGVNTNTLAGIMAASNQRPVTINVNGPSIIDEEGFTRALNNAQNNSFFRGTGGATNLVGI
jgi:hypothetical protein